MSVDPGLHYPINLDSLPRGWRVCYVGDAISDIQPGFASGVHNQEGNGIPHLRPMNVDRGGRLDLSVVKYVANSNGPRLQRGDVLFNNTNSPELIGKTASIDSDEDWAFSNHMTRLRPPQDIYGRFVAHQLHFVWMSGYFKHRCVKHVNQASIASSTLAKSIPLIFPPLDEQRQIVAEIEKQFTRLEAGVAGLRRVHANLKRYRAAVLKAACEGKLVPTEACLRSPNSRRKSGSGVPPLVFRRESEARRLCHHFRKRYCWRKSEPRRLCHFRRFIRNRRPTSRTHPHRTPPEMEWKGEIQRSSESQQDEPAATSAGLDMGDHGRRHCLRAAKRDLSAERILWPWSSDLKN